MLPKVALRAVAPGCWAFFHGLTPQCYELSTLTKPPNGIGR